MYVCMYVCMYFTSVSSYMHVYKLLFGIAPPTFDPAFEPFTSLPASAGGQVHAAVVDVKFDIAARGLGFKV